MILGGNLTLQGKNLSLACFHGINFRSKAWAIFTMNDVYISFATEAQKTQDQGGFYWKFRNFREGRFAKIKLSLNGNISLRFTMLQSQILLSQMSFNAICEKKILRFFLFTVFSDSKGF